MYANALTVCFVSMLSAQVDPTPCCCYVPWEFSCCAQVLANWHTYCGGQLCEGPHLSTGAYTGSVHADKGQDGWSLVQSEIKPNGTRCRYCEAYCYGDDYCVIAPEWTTWECHDELFESECQG